jgi:hypothetical protein
MFVVRKHGHVSVYVPFQSPQFTQYLKWANRCGRGLVSVHASSWARHRLLCPCESPKQRYSVEIHQKRNTNPF